MFSTDNLPAGYIVQEVFGIIQYTGVVEISKKGLLRSMFEKNRNEYQEIIDNFVSNAPDESNAILGVQISTSTQQFNNGVFHYITYLGTPAVIGPDDKYLEPETDLE